MSRYEITSNYFSNPLPDFHSYYQPLPLLPTSMTTIQDLLDQKIEPTAELIALLINQANWARHDVVKPTATLINSVLLEIKKRVRNPRGCHLKETIYQIAANKQAVKNLKNEFRTLYGE